MHQLKMMILQYQKNPLGILQNTQRPQRVTQLSQLSDMTGRMVKVRSTDDRVELIAKNVQKGRISPRVHVFAAAALAQKCDGEWCIPPMKWRAEVQQLGQAIQDNVRYTLDTYNIDTYRTPDRTLQMAIGDCDDMTALGARLYRRWDTRS